MSVKPQSAGVESSEAESVRVRENAQRDVQVDGKKHSGDDLA